MILLSYGLPCESGLFEINIDYNEKEDGDYRTYTSPKDSDFEEPYKRIEESLILDFLVDRDVNKIIKEASVTAGGGFDDTDDGPSFGYGNFKLPNSSS